MKRWGSLSNLTCRTSFKSGDIATTAIDARMPTAPQVASNSIAVNPRRVTRSTLEILKPSVFIMIFINIVKNAIQRFHFAHFLWSPLSAFSFFRLSSMRSRLARERIRPPSVPRPIPSSSNEASSPKRTGPTTEPGAARLRVETSGSQEATGGPPREVPGGSDFMSVSMGSGV